jgi:hypothetical protein
LEQSLFPLWLQPSARAKQAARRKKCAVLIEEYRRDTTAA